MPNLPEKPRATGVAEKTDSIITPSGLEAVIRTAPIPHFLINTPIYSIRGSSEALEKLADEAAKIERGLPKDHQLSSQERFESYRNYVEFFGTSATDGRTEYYQLRISRDNVDKIIDLLMQQFGPPLEKPFVMQHIGGTPVAVHYLKILEDGSVEYAAISPTFGDKAHAHLILAHLPKRAASKPVTMSTYVL